MEAAVAFGLCALRLGPADIWALTPRELAMAVRFLAPPNQGTARAELEALMAAFPDDPESRRR